MKKSRTIPTKASEAECVAPSSSGGAFIEDESTNEHGEGSSASFEQGDSASLDGFVVPDDEASESNCEPSEAEASLSLIHI